MTAIKSMLGWVMMLVICTRAAAFDWSSLADSAYDIVEHDELAADFQKGDTNTPLLVMDWFIRPDIDVFCRVSRSGEVVSAWNVLHWAIEGGGPGKKLDQHDLQSLTTAINALPRPPQILPPPERWLSVRGIRDHHWFKYIYDRAHVPRKVEALYEITGGYLEWSMPEVKSRVIAHVADERPNESAAGLGSFCVASAAPMAVSADLNGIEVWDLKRGTATPLAFLKTNRAAEWGNCWDGLAISPDGSIVVFASSHATFAVDWKAGKILWQGRSLNEPDARGCYGKQVAIGGDHGQFLFAAGAGKIERWDLATGKCLAVLATNQPGLELLKTSRNGRILVAGFSQGQCGNPPNSYTVWKADEAAPAGQISEPSWGGLGISPDGRKILLCVAGQKYLQLWDWRAKTTRKIPFREPYGSITAYALYWSPDEKRCAALVNFNPGTMVVYDAKTWRPLGQWFFGQQTRFANFDFASDGTLVGLQAAEVVGLDGAAVKGFGD